MPRAVLLPGDGQLFLVDLDRRSVRSIEPGPFRTGAPISDVVADTIRRSRPSSERDPILADPRLSERLRVAGIHSAEAGRLELRAARELLPWPKFAERRERYLARAREALATRLSSPEETLIALAREEERVERAILREQGAAAHWLGPAQGVLAEYARTWESFRSEFDRHHRELLDQLETEARRTVPNLSRIVGPRVAARLVAAAGSLAQLGRMPSARLQLLGARRRAGPERGPRYGVLAIAVHTAEIPPSAWGAYARSLAALAAIAARADATTRAPVASTLEERRWRRVRELAQRAE